MSNTNTTIGPDKIDIGIPPNTPKQPVSQTTKTTNILNQQSITSPPTTKAEPPAASPTTNQQPVASPTNQQPTTSPTPVASPTTAGKKEVRIVTGKQIGRAHV